MVDPILAHIGSRIRLYRKTNKLTMDELALKVHKTKASISKYESGQTSMDIVTLFDIAAALCISPHQLIDYTQPARDKESCATGSGFGQHDRLYLYHMTRKTVHFSILALGPRDESGQNATLFYKVGTPEKLEDCDCIYHGYMYSHEMVLNFTFRNYHNPVENILISFSIPIRKTSVLTGMISGLGVDTLVPTSHKIVLSYEQHDIHSDELRRMLIIDPKAFKEMKTANMLFIPL